MKNKKIITISTVSLVVIVIVLILYIRPMPIAVTDIATANDVVMYRLKKENKGLEIKILQIKELKDGWVFVYSMGGDNVVVKANLLYITKDGKIQHLSDDFFK